MVTEEVGLLPGEPGCASLGLGSMEANLGLGHRDAVGRDTCGDTRGLPDSLRLAFWSPLPSHPRGAQPWHTRTFHCRHVRNTHSANGEPSLGAGSAGTAL